MFKEKKSKKTNMSNEIVLSKQMLARVGEPKHVSFLPESYLFGISE